MSFIFSIISFLFIGLLIVVMLGLGLLRSIFGFGRSKRQRQDESSESYTNNSSQDKQKIFDQSEGEYVDFEEVEEDVRQ